MAWTIARSTIRPDGNFQRMSERRRNGTSAFKPIVDSERFKDITDVLDDVKHTGLVDLIGGKKNAAGKVTYHHLAAPVLHRDGLTSHNPETFLHNKLVMHVAAAIIFGKQKARTLATGKGSSSSSKCMRDIHQITRTSPGVIRNAAVLTLWTLSTDSSLKKCGQQTAVIWHLVVCQWYPASDLIGLTADLPSPLKCLSDITHIDFDPSTTLAKMVSPPLLTVPTELLLAVVEAIDDAASLRSFALTCKLARLLTEPVLYRAVLVTTGSQASCLAKSLQQQQPPTRVELVRVLDLRPEYDEDADADVEALTPLVGAMTQLGALSMESPFANYSHWRSEASLRRWEALMQGYRALFLDAQCDAGLQKLDSLTIHWTGDGSPFWLLTEFKPILTLPALQSLTISCAVLDDDLTDGLAAFAGTTPLTHLELVECSVSQMALTAVLALPRALRSCHLGIMRYHTSPSNTYHEASPEQQMVALRQQRHSLQQLTWFDEDFAYETDVCRVSTVSGRGLYDFTELHTLTLDGVSALLFSILLSECAPPNLDRLRIIRHDEGTILDHPTDSVTYARIPGIPPPFALHQHLPTLHHLDLVFSPQGRYEHLWANPDRRDHVKRLGEDYHVYGIRLAIFTADRGSTHPPYLFGEVVPCEEPAYRAENAWFSPLMT
ncbi:hypothetical protein B0H19DRAFT_1373322 [Mycena capillaripes]|nr:hypothetical protein B0H19DRAFT_1373322 [Mycena capillaripes]